MGSALVLQNLPHLDPGTVGICTLKNPMTMIQSLQKLRNRVDREKMVEKKSLVFEVTEKLVFLIR